MARKVLNRKELREEHDAAEEAGLAPKAAVKKAPAKRKSRSPGSCCGRRRLGSTRCWTGLRFRERLRAAVSFGI